MTENEALERFGLPAAPESRSILHTLLIEQLRLEEEEKGDQALIRLLCAQLFSIGAVEDSLLIWSAKESAFDLMLSIDVQFLCGAGLEPTKRFLEHASAEETSGALKYLRECEEAGDFVDFTPEQWLAYARDYYGIS